MMTYIFTAKLLLRQRIRQMLIHVLSQLSVRKTYEVQEEGNIQLRGKKENINRAPTMYPVGFPRMLSQRQKLMQ